MDSLTLNTKEVIEIEIFTHLALTRLHDEKFTPGERIDALLKGSLCDRIPFQIIDNTSRLIGETILNFFFNPVIRYKSLCAQIFRWGVPMTENVSRINSYKIGENMGAELHYSSNEAPSTRRYILKDIGDFDNLKMPDITQLLDLDLWLINAITNNMGTILGKPCCFLYPPFSWAATYLRDANLLFTDIFDNPDFVHKVCRFATDMELSLIKSLTGTVECAFFMPGGFTDILSPDQYLEFGLPYLAELINENPGCLFYVPIPGNFRQIKDIYAAVKGHDQLICMGSSVGDHTPLKTINDLKEFCSILDRLDRPYQLAINQNVLKTNTPRQIISQVEEMLKIGKKESIMFRTDTLDPTTPSENIDALIYAVKKYGSY